jgi:filamentous hemagglutinin family protein
MNSPQFQFCLLYICLFGLGAPAALAQSITPANDGTGSLVNANGNQYDITGGSVSGDGVNLFHSFERFGLTQAEIANFIADPAIQNILGRITGGSASMIDGLLQVSGSGANLYLINPAGILFGPNSALNLEGSFTATTATGIGFGGSWLQAIGSNDYAALVGSPTGLAFAAGGGGAIANVGNLTVSPGETLTLVGGSVINTGTLTAPSGQITIQAVPGENLVRISQSGSLLSLELATLPEAAQNPNAQPLNVLDLPALLTGGNTGITVNANNTLTLPESATQVPGERGDAIVSGSLDASGEVGGAVQVLGDRIALLGADINASGTNGGGTVLIGGDYQGQGTVPTASRTYVSADSSIAVDALRTGNGGEAIVWADQATQFYGSITARGGSQAGDGGFVEVSGLESLDFQGTVNATAPNGQTGTLLLDPNNITIVDGANNPNDLPSGSQLLFADFPGLDVTINNGTLNAAQANVVLQAAGQVTFNAAVNIAAPTVSLTVQANGDILVNRNITTNNGAVVLNSDRDGSGAGAIRLIGAQINTNGGDIILGGGADPTTNPAVGTTTLPHGVRLNNSTLNSSGGDISLRGQQVGGVVDTSGGVWIETGSAIDSGTGRISIAGTAASEGSINNIGVNIGHQGSATVTSANPTAGAITIEGRGPALGESTNSAGVVIQANSTVNATAAGGGIQITGTGGVGADVNRNHGILLIGQPGLQGGDTTISTGSGPIVLNGTAGGGGAAGIGVGDTVAPGFGGNFVITSTSGNITLMTDSISISNLDTNFEIRSNGTLTIQPQAAGRPIQVGGTENNPVGALEITQKVLEALRDGFSTITIGRPDGSGAITLAGNVTFSDPVILRSPVGAGSINTNSLNILGTDSLTLQAGNSIVLSGNTQITSVNGQPIAISLIGDSDNDGEGSIVIESGSIASRNGDITLIGRSTTGTGVSLGLSSRLNSQGGNIIIDAISTAAGTGTGLITFAAIQSEGGNITLNGANPGTPSEGIIIFGDTINAGSGTLTLIADGIYIDPAGQLSGSGSLILQPFTPELDLTLGMQPVGGFLSEEALRNLTDGFTSITIGREDGSGAITLEGNVTFRDPVILRSPVGAGSINTNGFDILGTDSLTLQAGNSIVLGAGTQITSRDEQPIAINLIGDSDKNGIGGIEGGAVGAGATIATLGGPLTASGASLSLPSIETGGGSISLAGDTVTTGNLSTRSPFGLPGGDVTIQAQTRITTGAIDTSSSLGNGGNVFLDPLEDIEVGFINAQGGSSGTGGDIYIATQRFFRATDTFLAQSGTAASLSSAGGQGGGSITVIHGGGQVPFRVGDAAINGTAGAILSGFAAAPLALNQGSIVLGQLDLETSAGRIRIINTAGGGGNGSGGGDPDSPRNLERPCFRDCEDTPVNLAVDPQQELGVVASAVLTQTPNVDVETAFNNANSQLTSEIVEYLGIDEYLGMDTREVRQVPVSQVQANLNAVPNQIPALLVVGFGYSGSPAAEAAQGSARDSLPLELILITPEGEPVYVQVPEATRRQVLDMVERLRRQVSDPNLVGTNTYLESAQWLYRWLITPLEATLAAQNIDSLAFAMDEGLRSLPIAALHNGRTFLIEQYSLGLIPSLNLVDLTYRDISGAPILVGGATNFATEAPLLAAEIELRRLEELSQGPVLTDSRFTVDELKQARQEESSRIVHLATHGAFVRGSVENSYLQFADRRLRLNQLRQLNWHRPPVDLVTLSACQTAMGNREAELGFAGLAIAAGARSALASLWKISDESTSGLMLEFYHRLQAGEIKATALQSAQLAMLRGGVYTEDDQLVWSGSREDLPPELAWTGRRDFSHPFYWAAFTLVGSPW